MSLHHVALLLALLLPLALDTFLLSAALGMAGMPREQRLPISLTLAAFEAGMPIAGVFLGSGAGVLLGRFSGYTAAAVIGLAGIHMLRPGDDDDKEQKSIRLLGRARGLAVIDLGLSISIDELMIGTSLGLLHIPVLPAVIFLAVQSFVAGRLGLWLGARLTERLREGAEQTAGAILLATAIGLVAVRVAGRQF